MKKIKIGNKTYNVDIASTDSERERGLQNKTKLPENEGMLFEFDSPQEVSMWMKDTQIPLDIVFINSDMEVISVLKGVPNSETLLTEDDTLYVLEVNKGSGISPGDELDFTSDIKVRKDKMLVLDENGAPQMELDGGERIFSRKDTKILIKFAKKAALTKKESDYRALGKRLFKFLEVQNNNDPEYVTKK